MMKTKNKPKRINSLMALMIFGAFAVCIFIVVISGADLYKKLINKDSDSFNMRTVGQYITTRIHQADLYDDIGVEDFCGTDAVVIKEEIDGEVYKTRLYCYDGYLMELFGMDDIMLMPEDGEIVMEVDDISFSLEDGILKADISVKEGEAQQVCVFIRSGEGALYEK